MTRTEALARAKAQIEAACQHHETRLVIDLALSGMPPEQILDAYRNARDWNEQCVIDGLKEAERIIDGMLSDTPLAGAIDHGER